MANTQTSLTFDMIGRDKGAAKNIKDVGKASATSSGQVDKLGKSTRSASGDIDKVGSAARMAQDDLDKVGESAEGLGDKFKGLALAGGAVAAAGLGAAFVNSLNIEAANDKLAGQLDLTKKESARIGGIAGELYAGAYGDSMEDVNNAVGAVMSSIEGMSTASSKQLETTTKAALNFASAFEVDVARAAQVAGQLVTEGLAKNAQGAFDLLIKSSQEVPAAVREDLLDASDEYGQFFRTLGFDGEQAFGVLVDASKKGMYGLDKAGDAIKEFTIRATDGSDLTQQAFMAIGLNANNMSDDILAGGDTARKAFDKIVQGLLDIEDPSERARAALKLFGTPLEDMNVQDIPKFLEGLKSTSSELKGVAGSAQQLDKTLGGNAKTSLTQFTRQIQTFATNVLGNEVIPKLEEYGKKVQENFGPVVSAAAENVQKLPQPMKDFGVALGIAALAGPKVTTALQNMTAGVGNFMTDIRTAPNKLQAFQGAIKGVAGAAGLGLLITGFQETNQAARTFENVAGGAALGFAAGGPWGAAIGAGAGGLLSLAQHFMMSGNAAEDASQDIAMYASTLNKMTGATTRATRELVAQKLQEQGVLDSLEFLNISTKDYTSAILGNKDAQKAVNQQLQMAKDRLDVYERQLYNAGYGTAFVNAKTAALRGAIGDAEDALHSESGEISKAVDKQQQLGRATVGVTKDISNYQKQLDMTPKEVATTLLAEGIDKAIGGTEKFRDRVNSIMDSIRDEGVNISLSAQASKTAAQIAQFAESFHATGGMVRGQGNGTSDSVRARLSPGEYVIREKVAKQIYPFLGSLNAGQAEAMEAAGARSQKGRVRFAQGGKVMAGKVGMTPYMNTSKAIDQTRDYANYISTATDNMANAWGSALSKAINKMLAFGGSGMPLGPGGTLSMGQIAHGQAFAKSQAGKPYIWGGVGPGGYDCSGLQSAVLNSALGQYPYSRRGSTGTMPWAGSRPGVGRYTIGWFTGNPGHTSGNIGGLGVESAGGVGVRVGSGATSPLSSMFNGLMHYDRGGVLKPGLTLAYNGTGRNERVSTGHGPGRYVIEVDGQQLNAVIRDLVREEVHDEFAYQHGGI